MDQNDIDITGHSQLDCLAGTNGNNVHLAVVLRFKGRQQGAEQPGVFCRGGCRQFEVLLSQADTGQQGNDQQREEDQSQLFH